MKNTNSLYLLILVPLFLFSLTSLANPPVTDVVNPNVKISPDGAHIAFSMVSEKESTIMFLNRKTFKPVGRIGFSKESIPGNFYWVNNERIVFSLLEIKPEDKTPHNYGQLFGVNLTGKEYKVLYGYNNNPNSENAYSGRATKKKINSTRGWATVLDILPHDPKTILIESVPYPSEATATPTVYQLNVYSGIIKSRIAVSPVKSGGFQLGQRGHVRLAYGYNSKDELSVYHRKTNKEKWVAIDSLFYSKNFRPIAFFDNSTKVIVADKNKAQTKQNDKYSLFIMDVDTGIFDETLVTDEVLFSDIAIDPISKSITGVRINRDKSEYQIIKPETKESKLFKKLTNSFPGKVVRFTSKSSDNNFCVVQVGDSAEPAVYYLYQKDTNQLKQMFPPMPNINPRLLVSKKAIEFSSNVKNGIKNPLSKVPKIENVH